MAKSYIFFKINIYKLFLAITIIKKIVYTIHIVRYIASDRDVRGPGGWHDMRVGPLAGVVLVRLSLSMSSAAVRAPCPAARMESEQRDDVQGGKAHGLPR